MAATTYPMDKAPRGHAVDTYLRADGTKAEVSDPYRSLEDPDSESTKAWVNAQNEITRAHLSRCDLKGPIQEELTKVWNYPKLGLVAKKGDHYYFQYNTGLQNQYVQYKIVAKNTYKLVDDDPLKGAEVFLDPNDLATDGTASIGGRYWSDDGRYMAYKVQLAGSDWATFYIRDSETGRDVDTGDELAWSKFSGASWTKDSKGFFYSRFDEPKNAGSGTDGKAGAETEKLQFQKVYYHRVGTAQSEDVLIYQDSSQPDWMFSVFTSNDGNTLFLEVRKSCDDICLISYADMTDAETSALAKEVIFTPVVSKWIGGFSYIHNEDTRVYFKTNCDAPRAKVVAIDLKNPEKENWEEVLPQHEKNVLQNAICYNKMLVANYLKDAADRVSVLDYSTPANLLKEIQLPDIGSFASCSGKWDTAEMFYKFTSFTDPGSSYRIDLSDFSEKRLSVTKLAEGSPDPAEFITDQVFYESKDGTKVPMFLVRKKSTLPTLNAKPDAPIPTVLYGYGGFNISLTPSFSPARLVYLHNLGGVFAVANIRGGGEYGEDWHKAGTLEKKQNVFDDFIAAAEYLQERGISSPQKTCIMGGSNGGTLVAACANQRPDLFGAVICHVPVTDMLRFHKFTIGHFWCSDFGCADKDGGYDYLIKYSPLHNCKPQVYPSMLVLTADHDDRVVPLHTFKYVAELQHQASSVEGQKPLLARIEVNAGHGAGKPTAKVIEENAECYAFAAKALDATWTV